MIFPATAATAATTSATSPYRNAAGNDVLVDSTNSSSNTNSNRPSQKSSAAFRISNTNQRNSNSSISNDKTNQQHSDNKLGGSLATAAALGRVICEDDLWGVEHLAHGGTMGSVVKRVCLSLALQRRDNTHHVKTPTTAPVPAAAAGGTSRTVGCGNIGMMTDSSDSLFSSSTTSVPSPHNQQQHQQQLRAPSSTQQQEQHSIKAYKKYTQRQFPQAELDLFAALQACRQQERHRRRRQQQQQLQKREECDGVHSEDDDEHSSASSSSASVSSSSNVAAPKLLPRRLSSLALPSHIVLGRVSTPCQGVFASQQHDSLSRRMMMHYASFSSSSNSNINTPTSPVQVQPCYGGAADATTTTTTMEMTPLTAPHSRRGARSDDACNEQQHQQQICGTLMYLYDSSLLHLLTTETPPPPPLSKNQQQLQQQQNSSTTPASWASVSQQQSPSTMINNSTFSSSFATATTTDFGLCPGAGFGGGGGAEDGFSGAFHTRKAFRPLQHDLLALCAIVFQVVAGVCELHSLRHSVVRDRRNQQSEEEESHLSGGGCGYDVEDVDGCGCGEGEQQAGAAKCKHQDDELKQAQAHHFRGFSHNDLQLANVLLSRRNGHVVLCDFELVGHLPGLLTKTQQGDVSKDGEEEEEEQRRFAGSDFIGDNPSNKRMPPLEYRAPEGYFGVKYDEWCVGLLAVELFTGVQPLVTQNVDNDFGECPLLRLPDDLFDGPETQYVDWETTIRPHVLKLMEREHQQQSEAADNDSNKKRPTLNQPTLRASPSYVHMEDESDDDSDKEKESEEEAVTATTQTTDKDDDSSKSRVVELATESLSQQHERTTSDNSKDINSIAAALANNFLDFCSHCLVNAPEKRWTVEQLIQHPLFAVLDEDVAHPTGSPYGKVAKQTPEHRNRLNEILGEEEAEDGGDSKHAERDDDDDDEEEDDEITLPKHSDPTSPNDEQQASDEMPSGVHFENDEEDETQAAATLRRDGKGNSQFGGDRFASRLEQARSIVLQWLSSSSFSCPKGNELVLSGAAST